MFKKGVANHAGKELSHKDVEKLELSEKIHELVLTGNALAKLPASLGKKCPNLSVLKIDKNRLTSFPTIPIVRANSPTASLQCLVFVLISDTNSGFSLLFVENN